MQTLLDKPEEAKIELRGLLTDPAYDSVYYRQGIAVWASYFGDHEFALQVFREIGSPIFTMWRPIHRRMRELSEFKDFVQEIESNLNITVVPVETKVA